MNGRSRATQSGLHPRLLPHALTPLPLLPRRASATPTELAGPPPTHRARGRASSATEAPGGARGRCRFSPPFAPIFRRTGRRASGRRESRSGRAAQRQREAELADGRAADDVAEGRPECAPSACNGGAPSGLPHICAGTRPHLRRGLSPASAPGHAHICTGTIAPPPGESSHICAETCRHLRQGLLARD